VQLRNIVLPTGVLGNEEYMFLSGKPTDAPKVFIYLVNTTDGGDNCSLWKVEELEDNNIRMTPYKGEDSEELKGQLALDYVEHAFEGVDDNNDRNITLSITVLT